HLGQRDGADPFLPPATGPCLGRNSTQESQRLLPRGRKRREARREVEREVLPLLRDALSVEIGQERIRFAEQTPDPLGELAFQICHVPDVLDERERSTGDAHQLRRHLRRDARQDRRRARQHPEKVHGRNLPPRSEHCQGVPSSLRNRAHSEATGLSRSSFAIAQRSNSSRASFARCCRARTFPRSRCASPTSGHSSAYRPKDLRASSSLPCSEKIVPSFRHPRQYLGATASAPRISPIPFSG